MHRSRRALTLLETLVAIGILGILAGLIVPALQKVRQAALRTQSKNQLRQIILGAHNYASNHEDSVPGCADWMKAGLARGDEDVPFLAMADYYEAPLDRKPFDTGKPEAFRIPLFIDPGDPTWASKPSLSTGDEGNCSYAFSVPAFEGANRKLSANYPDGLTNTIGFAGHYMRCPNEKSRVADWKPRSQFMWNCAGGSPNVAARRASFADAFYSDVVPVTDRVKHTTKPSTPNVTFQVAPLAKDCNYTVPQSPYRSGLIVAMMDGSVREIRPSVAPEVFWAAVTRNGGETFELD